MTKQEFDTKYYYGMRMRPFSPMCQPMYGLIRAEDDKNGRYHDIIVYNRPLSDSELEDYELDYLGARME